MKNIILLTSLSLFVFSCVNIEDSSPDKTTSPLSVEIEGSLFNGGKTITVVENDTTYIFDLTKTQAVIFEDIDNGDIYVHLDSCFTKTE